MLGSQTWFVALACPTILVGGFIASRKRLAYQWREELMDPESTAYPAVTNAEMEYFRRVAPAAVVEDAEMRRLRNVDADAMGVVLAKNENIGLRVKSDVLSPAVQNVYLNEVRRWSTELGNAIDSRKVAVFEARVESERQATADCVEKLEVRKQSDRGFFQRIRQWVTPSIEKTSDLSLLSALDSTFYGKLRFISDHAEDIQLMRAPWGCGDRMIPEKMPASLRHLVQKAEAAHENLGRLRHVYIEYSPVGKFFREPRTPKAYDGHDYVVVPLRRDGGDTVVTFAPALRSKFSVLAEVMSNSWTSRDIDAFVPAGAMLRTYGSARYDWGWGIRPGPVWFGSRLNLVNRAIRADELKDASMRQPRRGWCWWPHLLSRQHLAEQPQEGTPDNQTARGTAPFTVHGDAATKPAGSATLHGAVGRSALTVKPDAALPLKDAAIVVLHFEGPRAENKKRSLLLQPEALVFGKPPNVETYETWVDDKPTPDDVQKEGVVQFMLRRYFEMLTVS